MTTIRKFIFQRWAAFALAVLFIVSLGLMILRFNETPVGSITDDAYYVELARSIAEGKGPVLDVGPAAPVGNPHIFPPGFPLLLSPLAFLFPDSLDALKAVPLLATLGLAILCLMLPPPTVPRGIRLALAALVILNPWIVAWSGRILSDNIFALLSLASILAYLRWFQQGGIRKFVLLGVLVGFSMAVRTIGGALFLAMAIHFLVIGRGRRLPYLMVGTALGWLPALLVERNEGFVFLSEAYRDQLLGHSQGIFERMGFMWSNLAGYVAELPVAVLPIFGSPIRALAENSGLERAYPLIQGTVGIILAACLVYGIFTGWKSKNPSLRDLTRFLCLYLVIYGFALLNFAGYPSGVQTRLLIPVLPIIYLFLLNASASLRPPADKRSLILGTAIILTMSLAHNGWRIANPLHSSIDQSGRGFVDTSQGSGWIRTNTKPGDLIMVAAPLERHIHFDRSTLTFGDIDESHLEERVIRYSVRYIFIAPQVHYLPRQLDINGMKMLELVQSMPHRFVQVHHDLLENIYIFKTKDPGPHKS